MVKKPAEEGHSRPAHRPSRKFRWPLAAGLLGLVFILAAASLVYEVASQRSSQTEHSVGSAVTPSTTRPSPEPELVSKPLPQPVPILMYHYVRDYNNPRDVIGTHLSVMPATLAKHLDYLKDHGYHATTFSELASGRAIDKPVMLTFDDGFADAYTTVFPELQKRRMAGVFYFPTALVGRPGYVTWQQVREMAAAGMVIGAHSVDHIDLPPLTVADQGRQVNESIATITAETNFAPKTFAYPAGKYTPETVQIARAAGLLYAVTVRPAIAGPADDPLLLPRVRVMDGTNLELALQGIFETPGGPVDY